MGNLRTLSPRITKAFSCTKVQAVLVFPSCQPQLISKFLTSSLNSKLPQIITLFCSGSQGISIVLLPIRVSNPDSTSPLVRSNPIINFGVNYTTYLHNCQGLHMCEETSIQVKLVSKQLYVSGSFSMDGVQHACACC